MRLNLPLSCLLICALLSGKGFAATPDEIARQRLYQEQQTQQLERERILRQQQELKPDVRLPNQAPGNTPATQAPPEYPSNEAPGVVVNKINLIGELSESFHFALNDVLTGPHQAIGKCLGIQGINAVMTQVQNSIIAKGYVTTRVLAAPQDLKTGTLTLTIIPGRVHDIRFEPQEGHHGALWNALPMNKGDLLNLRDIEQALENFKRIPTAEADIQIEPARKLASAPAQASEQADAKPASDQGADVQPGESDLVIRYHQSRPFRISLNLDDSGSNSTGKYQAGITLSADNLLMLNDLAYVNYNHDLGGGDTGKRGTHGFTAHYSIPWDYWLLTATASDNKYNQTVAGASQTYLYSGTSQNAELELNRLIYRDATIKAGISLGVFAKASKNFIDDTEIAVQRRKTAGWQLGANYAQTFGQANLNLEATYKHGTGAFSALAAPEQPFGEGTSRFKLLTANVNLAVPFSLNAPWGAQRLQYTGTVRGQWNDTPLTPQERFSIGNRYSVRGFDGQTTLAADRGWLLRNEFSMPIASSGQALYIGADYGEVSGQSSQNLIGKYLAGAVIGARGGYKGLSYDIFVGAPLTKPKGFQTHSSTAGFNLNWSY